MREFKNAKIRPAATVGLFLLVFLPTVCLAGAQRMVLRSGTFPIGGGGGGGSLPAMCIDPDDHAPDRSTKFVSLNGPNTNGIVIHWGNGSEEPLAAAMASGKVTITGGDGFLGGLDVTCRDGCPAGTNIVVPKAFPGYLSPSGREKEPVRDLRPFADLISSSESQMKAQIDLWEVLKSVSEGDLVLPADGQGLKSSDIEAAKLQREAKDLVAEGVMKAHIDGRAYSVAEIKAARVALAEKQRAEEEKFLVQELVEEKQLTPHSDGSNFTHAEIEAAKEAQVIKYEAEQKKALAEFEKRKAHESAWQIAVLHNRANTVSPNSSATLEEVSKTESKIFKSAGQNIDDDSDLDAIYVAAMGQNEMPGDDKKHVIVYRLVQPTEDHFYGLVGPNGLVAYGASSADTVVKALQAEAADPNVASIYIDVSGVEDSTARGAVLSLKNAAVRSAPESVSKIYVADEAGATLFERAAEPITRNDKKPVPSEAKPAGNRFEQLLHFRDLVVRFSGATLDGLTTFVSRVVEKINAAILQNKGRLSLIGAVAATRHELKSANIDIDIVIEQAQNKQVVERKTRPMREDHG